jgi:hypothetical protein
VPFPSGLKIESEGNKMSKDQTEVTRVMQLYIDGAGSGNANQLNEAFHSSAHWFGTMDGVDYDMDKESFVAYMVATPGLPSKAEIVDIQIDGTAARATVKEEGFWESFSFTNFFNLSILDGRWQITNKTWVATSGGHV